MDKKVDVEKAVAYYKKVLDNMIKIYQRALDKIDECKSKGL